MLNGIQHISLQNFRNYTTLVHTFTSNIIILTGQNGSGKTNILEALSLLSPGKGLRNCKLSQINKQGLPTTPWLLSCQAWCDGIDIHIGSTLETTTTGTEKRLVRINQHTAKTQAALSNWVNVVWVIPAMARLFQESGSIRRKFIDRMVAAIDPNHSQRLHRYEHYVRERSTLLREHHIEPQWLTSLEQKIAADGIAIVYSRAELVRQLNMMQSVDSDSPFPRFFAKMQGACEEWCHTMTAVQAEEKLQLSLLHARSQDASSGGAAFGPHRSDLHVDHLAKQMPAELCSTGEQKMILLALFLAFIKIQGHHNDRPTLVLLDDVVAHLDSAHRFYLFDELTRAIHDGIKIQVWMTGTDAYDFHPLKSQAQFVHILNSTLTDGYENNDSQ